MTKMTRGNHLTLCGLMREVLLGRQCQSTFYLYARARGSDVRANFDELGETELIVGASRIAAELIRRGVAAGDYCLITCTSLHTMMTAFFAAIAIGAIPTIQPEASALRGWEALAARLNTLCRRLGGRCWVLAEAGDAPAMVDGLAAARGMISLDPDVFTAGPGLPAEAFHDSQPEDVAFLQATSGTTGLENLVAIPHRAIYAQVDGIADVGWSQDATISNWAPLNHDLGIIGSVLCPLCVGASSVMLKPPQFLLSPINWFRAIGALGVTHITMPDFGYAYCADYADRRGVPADVDFASLQVAIVSAEPIRERSLRRFSDAFSRHGFDPACFSAAYGMAETTLIVSAFSELEAVRFLRIERGKAKAGEPIRVLDRGTFDGEQSGDGPVQNDALTVFSNGRPIGGVEVQVLDDMGRSVAEGVCGELAVSGGVAALGYVADGGGAIESFEGDHVRTGDLGFLLDGEVYVVDRLKNVIIRYGGNHSASEIKQVLAEVTSIPDSRIMVLETDIYDAQATVIALIEVRKGTGDSLLATLGKACAGTDVPLDEVWLVRSGAIPKTTSGKKRYGAARDAIREGTLEILQCRALFDDADLEDSPAQPKWHRGGTAIQAEIIETVATFARRQHGIGAIGAETKLDDDLGLDSLQVFEIALSLQEHFGIVLRESDLTELDTVGTLVDRVATLLDKEQGADAQDNDRVDLSMIETMLVDQVPQLFNTITKQMGRRVWIGEKEAVDFASCNYLGLDLHPEVMAAIPPLIEAWGVHPSWTRAVASPLPYRQLEERLSTLLDSVPVTAFPTVTLLHIGVLPQLAGRDGVIFVDQQAHTSIREACDLARGKASRVEIWPHNDIDTLEAKLRGAASASRRVIAVDGVYSMTGTLAPLRTLRDLAERYDAIVYVDDAHGFGVLGETPGDLAPYGRRGNGIVKYSDLSMQDDRLVYVAGLSKAYSSMGAFVAGTDPRLKRLAETSTAFVFSGPVPVASLASALAGLEISEREGDRLRMRLADLTRRCVDGVQAAGFAVQDGASGCRFPIVQVHFDGTVGGVIQACQRLWEQTPAVLLTPAVYPSVPLGQAGVRLQITAGHTDADIEDTIAALAAAA